MTNNRTLDDEYCDLKLPTNYQLHWIIAYVSLALVGLFYTILGKRKSDRSESMKEKRKYFHFQVIVVGV